MARTRLVIAALLISFLFAAQPDLNAQTTNPAVTMDAAELFEYDRDLPLSPKEEVAEENSLHKAYKVSYYSTNDQRVPAMLIFPPGQTSGRLPAIVLMHGLGMNKLGLKALWDVFTKNGFAVLAIDGQYHGDRKPKEAIDVFGKSVYSSRDMLIQTVVDLRRGVDYLQSRSDIDPDRIGYAGFSMGGILGSVACAVDSRFNAPVIALAGGDFKRIASASTLPSAKKARESALDYLAHTHALDPVDPIHWVARISPRPVLFINGDHDEIVPTECGKLLQAAAGEPKEIMIYHGGHVPVGNEMAAVLAKITDWVNSRVKNKG